MKTHSQNGHNQNSRAAAHQSVPGNNAVAIGGVPAQFQTYSKIVTRPAGFDKDHWPAALRAGGGAADSSIAATVNGTLTAMGWAGTAMSAHMIPERIGGVGTNANVRPWCTDFEAGTWATDVEDAFNTTLHNAAPAAQVEYKVDTTEMTDGEAIAHLGNGGIGTLHPHHNTHKGRLKKIPTAVTATIGGVAKGPYVPVPAGRPAVRVQDPRAHTEEHISADDSKTTRVRG